MSDKLVHHYLDSTAELYPQKIAVTDGQTALTFGELTSQSDNLARFLIGQGVSPGDRVAYFLKRSTACIVATIGILKTGAAYVPIDQQTPLERWQRIVADSAPRVMLCDGTTLTEALGRLEQQNIHPPVVCFDQPVEQVEAQNKVLFLDANSNSGEVALPNDIDLDDVAYVMYTSGSTGSPKGVMVTHGNIRNYVDWGVEYFQITADDHILGTAPFYFDMSTFDIFCSLASGASFSIATGATLLFPVKLVQFAEQENITLWKGVSSLLMYMCRAGAIRPGRMPFLRTVIFAGEPLASQYLKQWMETFPETSFYNGYGPTEATGVSLCHHVKRVPDADQPIPIGQPCKGAKVALVGDDDLPVATGEIGELVITGPCLAKGYLNDPEKTKKHFTPPPSNCDLGDRMYRTGDLVRQNDDGDYVFVSRKDQQVKWMGYRIELGEIETNLLAHPQVKDAVVLLVEKENGNLTELVAFAEVEGNFEAPTLSQFLGERLPPYMIPKRFVRLDSLPRNDRGKVARAEILKNYSSTKVRENACPS